MNNAIKAGSLFFCTAVVFLGIQQVAYGDFIQGVFIAPSWLPWRAFWAYLSGAALIVTSLGLGSIEERRVATISLATILLLMFLLFHVTAPLAILHDGIARTRAFETLAMGAMVLALLDAPLPTVGRLLFAVTLVVFGIQHFMYAGFVAAVVPSWIPWPLAWAYITGVAMIAAGMSLATGVQARMAALLLGLMFFLWVVLLHVPRLAAHLREEKEWNSAAVALAMCGAAWMFAAIVGPRESAVAATRF